jgi:hypothetical protein
VESFALLKEYIFSSINPRERIDKTRRNHIHIPPILKSPHKEDEELSDA